VEINFFNPISKEMKEIDNTIKTYLKADFKDIESLNKHTVNKKGKKLRPAITILFGKIAGLDLDRTLKLGACFELLHTSTLIHDDVIDNAETRRGQKTHNSIWDNSITVLYGDFVFSSAMRIAVDIGSIEVLDKITSITRDLVSGELLQLSNAYNFPPNKDKYFQIIKQKTAVLFGGCCELPVLLSGISEKAEKAKEIGEQIGYAFQIIDDCLDYVAQDKKLGKPKLIDLKEGKATLPILLALEDNHSGITKLVEEIFKTRDITENSGKRLSDLLREDGYIDKTMNIAKQYVEKSIITLQEFEKSKYRDIFEKICNFIIERDF